MADDEQGDRQWIVEPPGPGEVSLQLTVGENVELNNDQRRALEALLQSFEDQEAEVIGHSMVSSVCAKLACPSVSCGDLKCVLSAGLRRRTDGAWSIMGTFTPLG